MKLLLNNIGKVATADVEIDGITVIAGENNTGKSTIGKALFSAFNSFYSIDKKILQERINSVVNQLEMLYRRGSKRISYLNFDITDLAKNIVLLKTEENNLENLIIETIISYDADFMNEVEEEDVSVMLDRIITILSVSDEQIFESVVQRVFDDEFNEQINNLYNDDNSTITLEIRGEKTEIFIEENKISKVSSMLNLGTEAIYLDDPFVLDEISSRIFRFYSRSLDHRSHLKEKLYYNHKNKNVIEEIVTNSKFETIYSKVSEVCDGNIIRGQRNSLGYRVGKSEKILDVRNLSTGLKTFAIIKKLLVSGSIEFNGTIILDEPEIHLHPEWQLVFAELIVLLHREFGLHILLNTHSPYFLNAIEVYSAKHAVDDKCKYYLINKVDDESQVIDVSNNIDLIYQKLARPLQTLENERYNND